MPVFYRKFSNQSTFGMASAVDYATAWEYESERHFGSRNAEAPAGCNRQRFKDDLPGLLEAE